MQKIIILGIVIVLFFEFAIAVIQSTRKYTQGVLDGTHQYSLENFLDQTHIKKILIIMAMAAMLLKPPL